MRGTEFAELSTFVAVAERSSFTKAAAQLGIALPTVSQTVRALEERLGVRLLNRTTRSVALTEAGARLLGDMRTILETMDQAMENVNAFRDSPTGTLRLTAFRPAAAALVAALLPRFLAEYPAVHAEVTADDTSTDIVSGHFDAGIRPGRQIEKDMIAVPLLKEFRMIAVAAPSYLERRAPPAAPADLYEHDCIRLRAPWDGALHSWDFRHRRGKVVDIAVQGRLIVNDVHLMSSAVLAGGGIGYLPEPMIVPELAEKRLARVMDEWAGLRSGLFLYYPGRRQVPGPLRAFIDFIERNRQQIIAASLSRPR